MEKNIIECIDRSLDQSNEGHETSERKEIRKYISAFHIIISIIIFSIDFIFLKSIFGAFSIARVFRAEIRALGEKNMNPSCQVQGCRIA